MGKVISFANHKGGVGKTCSCVNLGAGISNFGKQGKQVLLIDLDPQANLSLSLGIREAKDSIYTALIGKCTMSQALVKVSEKLHVIPATLDLSGAELELASEAGRELILKELIDPIKNKYDFILIDCPPSLGLLTLNALTASDQVYIPLQAQFLATQGLAKLNEVIEKVKKKLNKELMIGGVFLTQYDNRKVLNRDVAETVENFFKEKVFKTRIRDNIALGEAPSAGVDIFRYNPKSPGAVDYLALTKEMLTRS
jgi:chromosome partitioning protein